MNNTNLFQAFIVVMTALSLAGCRSEKKCSSVSEIWHNTGSLDGERICVRGQADFQFIPYHPMQVGGCSLDPDVVKSSHIVGKLDLLDEDSPDPERRLSISESSLHCEGNVCSAVCKPFAPSDTWGRIGAVEVFEFVGVLTVDAEGSEVVLILEDIDLQASRRMADGEWGPIPTGDFTYVFP